MASREEQIRERAYFLWLEEGRPEGKADDHWHRANALTGEEHGGAASGPTSEPLPPAGPHARPELTNEDATIGTGMLPPVGETDDANAQPSG